MTDKKMVKLEVHFAKGSNSAPRGKMVSIFTELDKKTRKPVEQHRWYTSRNMRKYTPGNVYGMEMSEDRNTT